MKVREIIRCQLQSTRDDHGNLCYGCPVADIEPIDRKSCARIILDHLTELDKDITFNFKKND